MSTARHILVVDDDEDLRDSLAEQLALHEEFETEIAGSAREAMDKLKASASTSSCLISVCPTWTGARRAS